MSHSFKIKQKYLVKQRVGCRGEQGRRSEKKVKGWDLTARSNLYCVPRGEKKENQREKGAINNNVEKTGR